VNICLFCELKHSTLSTWIWHRIFWGSWLQVFWTLWVNFWASFWPVFGQFLASFWPAFGQLLASFWPAFGQLLACFWPAFGPVFGPLLERVLVSFWTTLWPAFGSPFGPFFDQLLTGSRYTFWIASSINFCSDSGRFRPLALSPCHSLTLSPFRPFTLSRFQTFALSLSHPLTLTFSARQWRQKKLVVFLSKEHENGATQKVTFSQPKRLKRFQPFTEKELGNIEQSFSVSWRANSLLCVHARCAAIFHKRRAQHLKPVNFKKKIIKIIKKNAF